MEIRQLTIPDEIKRAQRLVWQTFLEFEAPEYSQEGIDEFKRYNDDEENFRAFMIQGAFINDKLVGVLALKDDGKHVSLFFVDKTYHRQGIGKRLFEFALKYNRAGVITVNSSPYAVGFYEKLGFVKTDDERVKNGIRFTPMSLEVLR